MNIPNTVFGHVIPNAGAGRRRRHRCYTASRINVYLILHRLITMDQRFHVCNCFRNNHCVCVFVTERWHLPIDRRPFLAIVKQCSAIPLQSNSILEHAKIIHLRVSYASNISSVGRLSGHRSCRPGALHYRVKRIRIYTILKLIRPWYERSGDGPAIRRWN